MGEHGQIWVCPFRSWTLQSAESQEWMKELSWFFALSYMVSGKLKVILGMHMIKYGCDLLGPGTLESASRINWWIELILSCNNFQTTNHALYLWLLNTGAPL